MQTELAVAQELINQNKTVSLAESCTGGLLCHRLTNVPGSSAFLQMSLISYSNASKVKLLKVSEETLKKRGAVSEAVAIEMAQGVRKLAKSDFGVSITGIAGPTGASKRKPIGLTYICVATKNEHLCLKCQFSGERQSVKKQAATQALKLLLEFL